MRSMGEVEARVVVREDISKVLGGRTYYLAERHTDKGVFGFWVDEEHKNKLLWENDFGLKTSK